MQNLYYTPLDIAAIIKSLDLKYSDKQNFITAIFIREQDKLVLKYRSNFRNLFLSISYWGHYLQNKDSIDAEFPAIKKSLDSMNIKILEDDFITDYSDLDLFFKSIRLRTLYLSEKDYVKIKLRTLLKRYGLKRRSAKFIEQFTQCLQFYKLQIYLRGKQECDIRTVNIDDIIIFRVKP
ncbi:MAG: hypothetical protein DBY32_01470 [Phascolarctobacterium sp.]|nr:MAG: hypothetical protein DBY32_01470 [Phascolarctobacterium sp.]